ncbi:cysteine desulfurase family protein [Corynebacterium tapiri]|uniref:Cysteine desulfurase n=1 Tax=Corynebacterium tapiri TaxID=1448266 RepID=A0A5C4U796_9CORY|nr:cysteine desulfurase family protein [Corynebacterium tapiri]TNL99755.1 cysteine desulfurase [Corynebacterium tapiri]
MIYLDHAATSPMRESAIEAWARHAGAVNPGAQYASGRKARSVLDSAREQVAEIMGADPVEVVFTASGTEADNVAVQGLFRASSSARIVASAIEHPAVAETVARLGADVELLPVDRSGHICDLSALDTPAALASCMMANNETGAIQPVEQIVARATAQGTPVHVDAVQAVGKIAINFHELGVHTLASSAHKFGGPRGAGFLLARRDSPVQAVMFGGGQERGLRPGTADVASAAALATALGEAVHEMEAEYARLAGLRDKLWQGISSTIDGAVLNTAEPALPGHCHVSFPGADGDSLIMLLDVAGIEASTGSACHAGVNRMSDVLSAMGIPEADGLGSLRLTLGRTTTSEDIEEVLRILPGVVERARSAGLR